MGNSYNNADHGVILKIIDTKFNDIWIYTRFTEHLPAIYAGSIDMPTIVGTAYARYNRLKDMETAVFKYTHTIIKKNEPPAKAPAAPSSPSAPDTPPAILVKSVTVESVTSVEPKTAAEQKLETWWSSRCVGVTHAVCEACKQMDADSKIADIHKYKYIYKIDRAEYNNTLSRGLNTTSPIIWSPRNPNHYAYVMGMFHNTIKDLPADKQNVVLQHFDLHTINRRWWKSSVVSHIKNSVDYANTLFFGIPENNWYDQWWFKTTERVITWILMIQAILAIVLVYIDVAALSNNIRSISGNISGVPKHMLYGRPVAASVNTPPATNQPVFAANVNPPPFAASVNTPPFAANVNTPPFAASVNTPPFAASVNTPPATNQLVFAATVNPQPDAVNDHTNVNANINTLAFALSNYNYQ